jgi:hypothetical protein
MGAAVNLRTGRVVWLPSTICYWPSDADTNFESVLFRANSILLVVSGLRNEKEGDQCAHFYRIEGDRFIFVRDIPRPWDARAALPLSPTPLRRSHPAQN